MVFGIIVGIIIGLLISLLVVATETYLYQRHGGSVKYLTKKVEGYNPPQGMIVEPFNEKKSALEANLKEKEATGEIIRDEDLYI